jgi:hypothetical protein
MKWFGPCPFSIACAEVEEAPLPQTRCKACEGTFVEGDEGYIIPTVGFAETEFPYHLKCFLKMILPPRFIVPESRSQERRLALQMRKEMPTHCFDCGAPLKGSWTQHAPSCSIGKLIKGTHEQ